MALPHALNHTLGGYSMTTATPRSRIARVLAHVALVIVLSVISTVGVAWTFALSRTQPTIYRTYIFANDHAVWVVSHSIATGRRSEQWTAREVLFPEVSQEARDKRMRSWSQATYIEHKPTWWYFGGYLAQQAQRPVKSSSAHAIQTIFGWPMPAMHYVSPAVKQPNNTGLVGTLAVRIPTRTLSRSLVYLPTMPFWKGFVVDVAFFGTLWSIALYGPTLVRRVIRRRGDHCPTCNYDLRGVVNGVCPECGAAIK